MECKRPLGPIAVGYPEAEGGVLGPCRDHAQTPAERTE